MRLSPIVTTETALERLPARIGSFPLEWLLRNERWQAVRIADLSLPLPGAQSRRLEVLLHALDTLLADDPKLFCETFVRFSQLHVGGCAKLVSARGKSWQPRMGLGVFPDQPAPEPWTAKDFEVVPGTGAKIRPMMNGVLRMSSERVVQEEVVSECLVSGGVLRVYAEDFRGFFRKSKEELLPRLQGSPFQGFLFYLPLLNGASFLGASDEELDLWLPGVTCYLAQCPEEEGLVLGLRGDLAAALDLMQERVTEESGPF